MTFAIGRQAVRRARRVGDDVVLGGIVLVLVHAHHDGDVFVGCGSRNDDLLHRSAQMLLGQFGFGELSGGFDDHLRANRLPIQLGGIFLGENLDVLAIDGDGIVRSRKSDSEVTEDGVVLQQMGQSLGIGEIVDGDELQARIVECGAKNIAANAAKAVDANFNCHRTSLRNANLKCKVLCYARNRGRDCGQRGNRSTRTEARQC